MAATLPGPGGVTRALAIDALRGLAILGMVLVAAEPLGVLPAWMYHAQTPPPAHETNLNLAGLTWPDVVFPFFLFALGVAIPLALAPRIDRGVRYSTAVIGALWRGALLLFFALFRQHFDSSTSGLDPEPRAWVVGLTGFAVLFAIFVRLPEPWTRGRRIAVRAAGWVGAALMFALITFPDGSRFRTDRIDVILLILAYCAVLATLVWVVTRHSVLARLAILTVIAALRIGADNPGWIQTLYAFDPAPWIYRPTILQFLCVVLPGTIAGDILLTRMNEPRFELLGAAPAARWSYTRVAILSGALLISIPIVLVGIQSRSLFPTTLAAALLGATAWAAARDSNSPTEKIIEQLVPWGVFWLVLGLVLDPFEGGTKKVPETYAWFFQGAGLALYTALLFTLLIDVVRMRWPLQWLIDIGQNPMVGYVGYGMFVLPLLGLTHLKEAVDGLELSAWVAFGWSVALTVMVALLVRICTRRRLLWRT